MTEWKQLTKNRRIKVDALGFSIIIPNERVEDPVPLECPICEYLMRSRSDVISFQRAGCCDECCTRWVDSNNLRWSEGWRPADSDIIDERKKRIHRPSCRVK